MINTRTLLIKVILATTALLCTIMGAVHIHAASYNVNAHINFPAPTQAAVIDQTLDNTTVTNALVNITGTCEVTSPYYVISIVRIGTNLGSTNCQPDGTFSINVTLQQGANVLIARSASVSNLYGPDSTPVTITADLPVQVIPQPSQPEAATPTQPTRQVDQNNPPTIVTADQDTALNAGARSNLIINAINGFSVINNDDQATIDIEIKGGKGPYTITVNWGDGSVDSKVVPDFGKHTMSHTYARPATYHVTGEVRDVLGAVTRFEYLVTTGKADPKTNVVPQAVSNFKPTQSINYLGGAMVGAFAIVGLASFFLGESVALHKSRSTTTQSRKH